MQTQTVGPAGEHATSANKNPRRAVSPGDGGISDLFIDSRRVILATSSIPEARINGPGHETPGTVSCPVTDGPRPTLAGLPDGDTNFQLVDERRVTRRLLSSAAAAPQNSISGLAHFNIYVAAICVTYMYSDSASNWVPVT